MVKEIVSDAEDDAPEIDWDDFSWKSEFATLKENFSIDGKLGGRSYGVIKGRSRGRGSWEHGYHSWVRWKRSRTSFENRFHTR